VAKGYFTPFICQADTVYAIHFTVDYSSWKTAMIGYPKIRIKFSAIYATTGNT